MQVFYLLAFLFVGIGVKVNAQLQSGNYDVATSTKLLSYAEIAYCSQSALNAWNCADCDRSFGRVEVFSNLVQLTYIVDNNKDTIIISFQGTDSSNIIAWINNLNANLKKVDWCSGCQVHSGFFDLYNLLFNLVKTSLQTRLARLPGARVFAVGHSLGGAAATLVSYNLVRMGVVPASAITVYTYGQPRTGNTAFAMAYNKLLPNTWRVVNHADIVPHIPPALLTDYYSTGTLVYCPQTATTSCQIRPGAEDDGSWTHFSIDDHLLYFGVSNKDYGTSADKIGCKPSPYAPRFLQIKAKLEKAILKLSEETDEQESEFSQISSLSS